MTHEVEKGDTVRVTGGCLLGQRGVRPGLTARVFWAGQGRLVVRGGVRRVSVAVGKKKKKKKVFVYEDQVEVVRKGSA